MPAKLWEAYRGGVCLIYGSYIFIDKDTGLPVVAPMDSSVLVGQTQTVKEAAGETAEVSFEATGFHTGDGYILTNRHTVEPWKFSLWPTYFSILRNARPRLSKLLAFFPDRSQPYALEIKLISPHDDIAICKLGAAVDSKEIPALPLDSGHRGDEIGDEVTMLSYPNGTDRLLAVTPVAERQRLLKRFGESSPALIRHFAQRKMIKPLMSRGQVMDLYDNRIVFGGTNAEGGSGAPLFGPSGRVIGINFGYFIQNESMNYAVPVERAISLLSKAGWKHID
jgi:hypothetical protein